MAALRVIVCGVLMCALTVIVLAEDEERKLYEHLFSGYNKKIRPRFDPNNPVDVRVELELKAIKTLDDHEQTVEIIGLILLEWDDDHLRWDPAQYAGLEEIVIPPSDVWLPDVAIINSADSFYDSTFSSSFRVIVRHTGVLDWAFGGIFITNCELDLTYYPFDKQKCEIAVENWAYNKEQVDLHSDHHEIYLEEYHDNGAWHLHHTDVEKELIEHETYPGVEYPKLLFDLYLERKYDYVMLNIIIPCLFLVVMTVFVFLLPADSGERVSLGITILLAFSVFQLILADSTPRSSSHVPVLTIYLVFMMGICILATVQSVWILYIHHHTVKTRPHLLVRKVIFKYVAKAVFITHLVSDELITELNPEDQAAQSNKPEDEQASQSSDLKKQEEEQLTLEGLNTLEKQRFQEADEDDKILLEWRTIGYVVDRAFFWIAFIVVLIVTPVLLGRHDDTYE